MGITERKEREKETEEISETIMTESFPSISVRHQTTDPSRILSAKPLTHLGISFSNYKKSKLKKKS